MKLLTALDHLKTQMEFAKKGKRSNASQRRGVLGVVEHDVWQIRSAHHVDRPVPVPRPEDTPTPLCSNENKHCFRYTVCRGEGGL